MAAWEASYGKLGWKGAWNDPAKDGTKPGFDPMAVPTLDEGAPTITAASGSAAAFLGSSRRTNIPVKSPSSPRDR